MKVTLDNITSAVVEVEALNSTKISVSVRWSETIGDDGDFCYGQNTILREAYKVLAALEHQGWKHSDFGGRKDMGHSGGTTHFACE